MAHSKLTEEEVKKVITAYKQGETTKKIGKIFSVAPSTILRLLKKNNIKIRGSAECLEKKFSPEQEKEIFLLNKEGKSIAFIANKLNCQFYTIEKFLRKNNIEIIKWIMNKKISSKQEQEIIALYSQSKTIKEIAKKYNVFRATITKILKKNNIKIIKVCFVKKVFQEQENKIVELYKQNLSIKEIVLELNLSPSSIIRTLKKYNLYIKKNKNDKKNHIKSIVPEIYHKEIVERYNKGLSISKLAEEFEVHFSTIKRIIDSKNIKVRPSNFYSKKEYSEQEQQVIELYKKGIPISQLQKEFSFKNYVIKKILKKNNIEVRSPGYYSKKVTEKEEKEIVKLYNEGLTKIGVAKHFKLSTTAIDRVLKENNIESRKRLLY